MVAAHDERKLGEAIGALGDLLIRLTNHCHEHVIQCMSREDRANLPFAHRPQPSPLECGCKFTPHVGEVCLALVELCFQLKDAPQHTVSHLIAVTV